MIKRIHIVGASASGTTTLADAISKQTGYCHFDTDKYYWLPTDVPFTQKRTVEERQAILKRDLEKRSEWILSGSLCGWGDIFIPCFELVIYLYLPKEIRMKRLIERERIRYGDKIEQGGELYQQHLEFVDWAAQYDEAGAEMRSKALHENWLSNLQCPVLRIEGDITLEEWLDIVLERIV
jgi:Adenylate kinase and related kinases